MSLEQAILDNTAAIYELISTLANQAKQVTLDLKAPKYDAMPANPVVTLVPPAGKVTVAFTHEVLPEPPAELIPEPTYEEVGARIRAVFTQDQGRAKVLAALEKFGAKKAPELKVGDYAAFLGELA